MSTGRVGMATGALALLPEVEAEAATSRAFAATEVNLGAMPRLFLPRYLAFAYSPVEAVPSPAGAGDPLLAGELRPDVRSARDGWTGIEVNPILVMGAEAGADDELAALACKLAIRSLAACNLACKSDGKFEAGADGPGDGAGVAGAEGLPKAAILAAICALIAVMSRPDAVMTGGAPPT